MNNRHLAIFTLALIVILSACQAGPAATTRSTGVQPAGATPTSPPTSPAPTEAPSGPATAAPTAAGGGLPVLFDDDGSPDGTTALLYLLRHPEVSLKAISISYGEAYPDVYIQHIGRVLDDFGLRDIPLGAGQSAPLAGDNEFPEGVREASNGFWGLPLPNADKTYPTRPAAQLMVDVLRLSPEPLTVFVSGPATNLAQALRLDPGIAPKIAAVFMMGGAVYVPGNLQGFLPGEVNTAAEWNIYADPQAAGEVFAAGLPLYLVPLDATNQVAVGRENTARWRQGDRVAGLAADFYDMLLANWNTDQAEVWDLMTAAIMVQNDLCAFEPLHLRVVTGAGSTQGQTAVVEGEQPNVWVCLKPDAARIRQTLDSVFAGAAP